MSRFNVLRIISEDMSLDGEGGTHLTVVSTVLYEAYLVTLVSPGFNDFPSSSELVAITVCNIYWTHSPREKWHRTP